MLAIAPTEPYDAVLCRGVLNDLLDASARRSVFAAFARALRHSGVLVLDVRDWNATAQRKKVEPVFRKSVSTARGELGFTSVTSLEPETHRLLVSERHTLRGPDGETSTRYEFVMQCWSREELEDALRAAGFEAPAVFGAYDPAIPEGATDRLVAVTTISS